MKWISVLFFEWFVTRCCFGFYWSWRLKQNKTPRCVDLQRTKKSCAIIREDDVTLQDTRSVMSRFVMPCPWATTSTFSPTTISQPGLRSICVYSPLPVDVFTYALWMLNGVSCFFGEGVFSRLRHPWSGKEMDCFADSFHCYTVLTVHTAPPPQIWSCTEKGKDNALYDLIQHAHMYTSYCAARVSKLELGRTSMRLHWKQTELRRSSPSKRHVTITAKLQASNMPL